MKRLGYRYRDPVYRGAHRQKKVIDLRGIFLPMVGLMATGFFVAFVIIDVALASLPYSELPTRPGVLPTSRVPSPVPNERPVP